MTQDELYMKRCLDLAAKGLGHVQPNPMVGAVIVKDGKIIAEGWHKKFGGPHAEINAINNLKDKSLLKQATMYVSLEPCAHFGKTPPCANAIVSYGIPKVVIGSTDPNLKVNGKGIEILKQAGTEVITGILKDECDFLNRRFFTFHIKKRPYILLKWAQTRNGFMDIARPNPNEKYEYWITNEECKMLTHKWRS
ncbi:MAG: bifunctional diaminohydroxyphosphoribosylaminopyrimidine deaminase/5-amino-6-(5-phosphoribosylamino)uracil reductase RibD, partial [Bacteroidales bacterium]|nr:bifunctional diaminohydroxyphosphoribosylaminopyrimidine deaminase/5-amino-6-(5-phosphoribosylamino)uracil reductase RibD [Bacteroidales bacterium]